MHELQESRNYLQPQAVKPTDYIIYDQGRQIFTGSYKFKQQTQHQTIKFPE